MHNTQVLNDQTFVHQSCIPLRKNTMNFSYLPPKFRSSTQAFISGHRSRRRRSNHSLAATMDPIAVARRNERERNRVKQVNDGFDALRKKIPHLAEKKKLPKVEILRFAMRYIRELQRLIDEHDERSNAGDAEVDKSVDLVETVSEDSSSCTSPTSNSF